MLTSGGVVREDIVVQYRSMIEALDEQRGLRADERWQIVFQRRCFDLGSDVKRARRFHGFCAQSVSADQMKNGFGEKVGVSSS